MNFVDALRSVATHAPTRGEATEAAVLTNEHLNTVTDQEPGVVAKIQRDPDGTSQVQLELHLTPEQTQLLLKAALGSQHRYLTLREAAAYLRVKPAVLEQWAKEDTLPAFWIDDSWRFDRRTLDTWVQAQAKSSTPNKGVA